MKRDSNKKLQNELKDFETTMLIEVHNMIAA